MKLLHLDSSILGEQSASREVSAAIVAQLRQAEPGLEVTYRDLAANPVPHLSGGYLAATAGAPGTESFQQELADSAVLMDEFLSADVVVIGAPMYNFAIPSQLKAWLDRVLVRDKTFRYTETGPQGLAGGKRVIVAIARGGIYSGEAPAAPFDFQEPYLRSVFGFIGITDVEFVRVEGVNLGPDLRAAALASAREAAAALELPQRKAA
jgi:FMN-dependent NADH-azoreductase